MTRQSPDTIIIRRKKYNIVAATDFKALLDVKSMGFVPKPWGSACYKGFIVEFKVEDGVLKLNNLAIWDNNDNYPDINGVEATVFRFAQGSLKKSLSHIKEYDNIDLDINYTGHIYTADYINCDGRIEWSTNIPFDYCTGIKDLYFENGILISITDKEQ